MGGSKTPSQTTSVQDVPPEFKPAFTSLFNSAFGGARTAAGQIPQNFWTPQTSGSTIPTFQNQAQAQNAPQPQTGGQPPTSGANQSYADFLNDQVAVQTGGTDLSGKAQGGASRNPSGRFGGGFYNPRDPYGIYNGGGLFDSSGNFTPPQFGTPSFEDFSATQPGSTDIPLAAGPPIIGQAFPGPFIAPTADAELESLAAREGIGRSFAGMGGPTMDLAQRQASGQFLMPGTNPFFQANLAASLQPAVDAFQRSTLPEFQSQALDSGAFKGSSARDFAMQNLANDFGRNLIQASTQQAFDNFARERELQQGSGQLLSEGAQLQQLFPEILAQVGAGQREIYQRPLDELLLQFQEQQQAPFRPLGPLASIIQGTNVGSVGTVQGPRPSPLASGIQGALGGAALGGGLAQAAELGTGGTLGLSGAGALLGALGGGGF